jgi:uncharacterized protein (DUF1697 family)
VREAPNSPQRGDHLGDPIVTRYVVLLRAINVGKRKAPMDLLRAACREAGFADVESYIQSGNLVLSSDDGAPAVEAAVEKIVLDQFGFSAEAIARTAKQWSAYAAGSPFPDVVAKRPQHLQLCLSKRAPKADAADRLMERATLGERVVLAGDALWVDFAGGVGESKLLPMVLDKLVGSTVTARGWNTVRKLHEMASA